jgi:hypothetical protein
MALKERKKKVFKVNPKIFLLSKPVQKKRPKTGPKKAQEIG